METSPIERIVIALEGINKSLASIENSLVRIDGSLQINDGSCEIGIAELLSCHLADIEVAIKGE